MTTGAGTRQVPADRFVTVIVIGAGQGGLAMSACLTAASIDHVLLERGTIANSWRTQRWDSFHLLSPRWRTQLPGFQYQGDDPDGFMDTREFVAYLEGYASSITAPVHAGVTVQQVSRTQNGYRVVTSDGDWQCRAVVLASGICNVPAIPASLADSLPGDIDTLNPFQYRNPDQLNPGKVLVVGASATGLQLAQEIQSSGREVLVATGEQVRMPRTYRGRDIMWWMDQIGLMDTRFDEVDDINRVRRLPSAQLIGSSPRRNLDINALQEDGVEFLGRMANIQGTKAQFSGSLANICQMADLKMRRLLKQIDEYAEQKGMHGDLPPADIPEPTRIPGSPRLEIDLSRGEVGTVIWATGFRPDYSWLRVPVLDRKGCLIHEGGVVDSPGLYAMGLPFMRRRKSQFIDGAGDDAKELVEHMALYLQGNWAGNRKSVA